MNKLLTTIGYAVMMLISSVSAQPFSFEAGLSGNTQDGHFIAPCLCTFAHGTGIGYAGALSYDVLPTSNFVFGVKAGVQYQKVTDYEVVPSTLQILANGDEQVMSLTYLALGPYARYTIPPTSIFLRITPEIDYLLSSDFQHFEGGTSHGATQSQTPMHADVEADPTIHDIRKIRYAVKFSIGYEFTLGDLQISPVATYDLPINTIRSKDTDDNWKITSYFGSVMIRTKL